MHDSSTQSKTQAAENANVSCVLHTPFVVHARHAFLSDLLDLPGNDIDNWVIMPKLGFYTS
jgi:hypothetical protein